MARDGKHYFDNEAVEALLTRYVEGACTDIQLRDEIMEHAVPLIRNVVLSSGHHRLLQYQHRSNVDDLAAIAWAQVEKTLYKYEPGRGKVFSLWTQIVYTVCMAYVKKETRDAVNVRTWKKGHPAPLFEKPSKPNFYKVMAELREQCERERPEYVDLVDRLVEVYETEDTPWAGLLSRLAPEGDRDRARAFLAYLKGIDWHT